MQWSEVVQEHEQHLFHHERVDTWIFRDRKTQACYAMGNLTPQAVTAILSMAEVMKYTSQRLRGTSYIEGRGWLRG